MATGAPRDRRRLLTPLQHHVLELVGQLPEAAGFALAGGAALIVRGRIARPTRDLDFFTTSAEEVDRLLPVLEAALTSHDLRVERVTANPGFARLVVSTGQESSLIDLAYDFRMLPAEQTDHGRVLAEDELAADKMLAMFGRADARDFLDVYDLLKTYSRRRLLELAREKDRGFNPGVFADMIATLDRHPRPRFPVDDATLDSVRGTFREWRVELDRAPQ
jgi:Nucleotidyl transferase AbiEii toxin, Type IV TA system